MGRRSFHGNRGSRQTCPGWARWPQFTQQEARLGRQACNLCLLGFVLKAARCQLPCNPTGAASFDGWGPTPSPPTVPVGAAEKGRNPNVHQSLISLHHLRTAGGRFLGLSGEIITSEPQIRAQDLTEEAFGVLKIHLYGDGNIVIAVSYIKSSLVIDLVNRFIEKKQTRGKVWSPLT